MNFPAATPLTPVLGARIENLDISKPLDKATVDWIQASLYQYGVLLFKNVQID
jgi:alpha-ketoglutarate-dependent taurine dioxygenase